MAEQRITVCVEPPDDPTDPDALRAAIGKAMPPLLLQPRGHSAPRLGGRVGLLGHLRCELFSSAPIGRRS
ncbi:protein of unknown function [Streptomyces murinus]